MWLHPEKFGEMTSQSMPCDFHQQHLHGMKLLDLLIDFVVRPSKGLFRSREFPQLQMIMQ